MLASRQLVGDVSAVRCYSPSPLFRRKIVSKNRANCSIANCAYSTSLPRNAIQVSGVREWLKLGDGFGPASAFGSVAQPGARRGPVSHITRAGILSIDKVVSAEKPIPLMLVTDLDFTMVDHEDKENVDQIRFNSLWAADYAHSSLLVFSTGRSPEKYQQLRSEKPLLTPDIGIFSVGTEILYGPSLEPDVGWENHLNDGWNRDLVLRECHNFPALKSQEESEQRLHKVSFYIEKDLASEVVGDLTKRLEDLGLKVKLIYSGGYALDILPRRAGKGEALAYLLQQLKEMKLTPKGTLVCGDSGNDAELYTVEGVKGVIVGNAMEELLRWYDGLQVKTHIFMAAQRCAGGIIEAIEHFGFGPYEIPADRILELSHKTPTPKRSVPTRGSATREVVEVNTALVLWVNGDCPNTDAAHNRILKVMAEDATMVYPWGEERVLRKSVVSYKDKYGLKKHARLQVWMDCVKEQKLADNIFLVTWQYWQQLTNGENRKGYFATAILRTKVGNPNGLEWLRVHETPRASS
ncbi:hypothetical protein R1sor_021430 [Riccia sorocarpa]|uniref:sucrose-phosphate phosphatase n=1 Tax=Riccia sorocarpa TaxID=122646 RepID=A0ABD3GL98_9MARC